MTSTSRRVVAPDGVTLAVHESGDAHRPLVVAVHGYPDDHHVWDGVAANLAARFRVVAYDVRGAGASDRPADRSAYRMPRLVDDLVAVLGSLDGPAAPVHLLGHDWGSVQLWPALTDGRLAGRVSSFTSISGPSLEHAGRWLRRVREHPGPSLRQLAHSYYIAAFQLPALPEAAVRLGLIDRGVRRAGAPTPSRDDAVGGIALYRANVGRFRAAPARVGVPVQVVVPERDPFVTPDLAEGAPRDWVDDLTVHRVPGGHWVVRQRPDEIARLVAEFATRHEPRSA